MNHFEVGASYHGFILEEKNEIEDIHSMSYRFLHQKSGARLLYLENSDDNKVFFIAFKTPPSDDCGTPHILEHSVLCGSRKYQSKDPFNELAKGSLNTYLNALTYADKTMYPVASRNEKDFINMMDVYLDAVFYPNIYDKKEIFQQEGWHYEMEEDELSISGVVYNEMKGALSDPEALLGNHITTSLFPTSIYRFESGGEPSAIPELSYEKFLDFHKTYYHPSNSYIYLYGDMDILPRLEQLDREYLSSFEAMPAIHPIEAEQDFSAPIEFLKSYPISAGESEKGKTFLSYNMRMGKCTNPEFVMAMEILNYMLLGTHASPLKNALLKSGLISDVEGWLDTTTYDVVYSIIGKKSEKEHLNAFCEIIENTLQKIAEDGLDEKLIESSLNRWEFSLREEDYGYRPKGLVYGMKLMKSWLHGENPCLYLQHWKHFYHIREESFNGYFENLIKQMLQNKNKSMGAVVPVAGQLSKENEVHTEKMKEKRLTMTEEDIHLLQEDLRKLELFQTGEESEEIKNQIPTLELHEVEKKAEWIALETEEKKGCSLCFIPLATNGIAYMQLLFDLRYVPQHLLGYAGILVRLLGKMDTENYSYEELPTEINLYTGGIAGDCDIFSADKENYKAFLSINGKTMMKNLKEFLRLVEEIIIRTRFDHKENLQKLLKTIQVQSENHIVNNGHMAAILRSNSALFAGSHIKEEMTGISFHHFLTEVEKSIQKEGNDLYEKLSETWAYLCHQKALTIAVCCERNDWDRCRKEVLELYQKLPEKEEMPKSYQFTLTPRQVAFSSTSKVQYNVVSGDYKALGYEYFGSMQVLQTVLNLEYLWNKVRVQGGAYGGGSNFLKNGSFYLYSYRDPNLEKTYQIYKEVCLFLEGFEEDEKQMTKYILGTINTLDRPKSNAEKFDLSLARYFMGITAENLQKERDEILETTSADIQNYHSMMQKVMEKYNYCTVGNEDKIQEQNALFTEKYPLLP
ncbi:MAG: insulinase family protein [Epulopiscium sp.]|jgi:Zn-dependent M16 (insulinase) family peptidase|nr:insulinase family protein [Candidatus Epulonipiscium sp.]